MAVRANTNTGQSPNSFSMLGQRRIPFIGIEPAMSCDAEPTLNRCSVGRPILFVRGLDAYTDLSLNVTVHPEVKETRGSTFYWQVLHKCWPAPVMVVEGICLHVEVLVSLVISIIISWTFKILAHEENQYSYV